jgi:hypothetical protein
VKEQLGVIFGQLLGVLQREKQFDAVNILQKEFGREQPVDFAHVDRIFSFDLPIGGKSTSTRNLRPRNNNKNKQFKSDVSQEAEVTAKLTDSEEHHVL